MKKRNIIKSMTAGAVAILLCVLAVMPISAMSPARPVYAMPTFSLYPAGGSSTLELSSLNYTFAADDVPQDRFERAAEFWSYQPSVTQRYTFYNPTKQAVSQTLYLPLAQAPEYAGEAASWLTVNKMLEASTVTVDGKATKPEIRYAYNYAAYERYSDLSYSDTSERVHANIGKLTKSLEATVEGIPASTPVTVYTFMPGEHIKDETHPSWTLVRVDLERANSATRVFTPGFNSASYQTSGLFGNEEYIRWSGHCEYQKELKVYLIGEGELTLSDWEVDGKKGEDVMIATGSYVTTLGEIADVHYDPAWGISERDWRYAICDMIAEPYLELGDDSGVLMDVCGEGWDVRSQLHPVLEFSVNVQSESSLPVTVSHPAYPMLWFDKTPAVAVWECHFPSTEAFGRVGPTSVDVETPLYMLEKNYYHTNKIEDYTVTDAGYTLQVPTGQQSVRFVLCTEQKARETGMLFMLLIFVLMLLIAPLAYGTSPIAIIIALSIIIPKLIRRRRRNKRQKKQAEQEEIEQIEQIEHKEDDANDAQ